MKVMHGKLLKSVPMAMLKPHEAQAKSNHGQTLERLNERGGMNPTEILGVIQGVRWGELKIHPDNELKLLRLVEAFEAENKGA
jgi:hypothetical protein